jgi:hypothetical protein
MPDTRLAALAVDLDDPKLLWTKPFGGVKSQRVV